MRRRTLKFPGPASRGVGRGPAAVRGKLEVEGCRRRATWSNLRGGGSHVVSFVCGGRRSAARARAAPEGVVRPRRPRGPAGRTRGRSGAEPSYQPEPAGAPASPRLLRAAGHERGPAPSRHSPTAATSQPAALRRARLSSRRSRAASTNQRGRRAQARPLRARLPGGRRPPRGPPGRRGARMLAPGMLRAASDQRGRLSLGRKFLPKETLLG